MIIGFLAILLMGIILGSLGAGGSILTVPILVYLFKIQPVLSTSYSLFLVGFTAIIGSFLYLKKGQIDFNIAVKFAIPSIISVYLTRRFLIPRIPSEFQLFGIVLEKDLLVLILFAIMMLLASLFMIRNPSENTFNDHKPSLTPIIRNILIIIESLIVGLITATVGAGGGFLIIPVLVLLNNISIKSAIGTSLIIIAAKSLTGFIGDIQAGVDLDYMLAAILIILSSLGMFLGSMINKYIDSQQLKKAFGYFLMITSVIMIIKETIL